MMVVGRKVAETADEVRYEFGFDRLFDRVLTIDKASRQAGGGIRQLNGRCHNKGRGRDIARARIVLRMSALRRR
jgi:hypothetical protein